jgi:hypothetical protein
VTIAVTFPGAGVPRVKVKTELPVPPAVRGTDAGLNEAAKPVSGCTARFTVPEKPVSAVRLTVEVNVSPHFSRKKELGFGERV